MQTNFQTLTKFVNLLNNLNQEAQNNVNRYITIDELIKISNDKNDPLLGMLVSDILDTLELVTGQDILDNPDLPSTLAHNDNATKLLYDYKSAAQGLDNLKPYTLEELIDEIAILNISIA